MASRIVQLLKEMGVKDGVARVTGGLMLDSGLLAAIHEEMVNEGVRIAPRAHPDSICAEVIGVAPLGVLPPLEARWTRGQGGRLNARGDPFMALSINDNWTAGDTCKPACPNGMVSIGEPVYVIDEQRCTECVGTECVGTEDERPCKLVCPTDRIVPKQDFIESPDELHS